MSAQPIVVSFVNDAGWSDCRSRPANSGSTMPTGLHTDPASPPTWRARTVDYLGLERNVGLAAGAVFLVELGEELWKRYLPKYLEALGAGVGTIGLFGTATDFLDAVYQYPGGWLADRMGRRRAFLLFIALAVVGYVIYLLSPSWPYLFLGLCFAMAWQSMASPAIFAVIADGLPKHRRTMGFTVQAIIKRIPRAVSPLAGGALIASIGIVAGIRVALIVTLVLSAGTVLVTRAISIPIIGGGRVGIREVWRSFDVSLKRLLVSDIVIRTCEGMAGIFIILYATNIIGVGIGEFGLLVAVQVVTSILVYIPSARIADRIGRKPFVVATFACFALFPGAVALSSGFWTLAGAFAVGGLREIGEPARKAMIVDFAEPHLRGRTVGLYYLVRSLSVTPAAAIGGLLWQVTPAAPFIIAGAIGLAGTVLFAATVEEANR